METEAPLADISLRNEHSTSTDSAATPATPTAAAPSVLERWNVAWDVPWLSGGLLFTSLLALFLFLVAQHNFVCDDAYIAFRYARNLVAGNGLVFNVDERVEGYTSLLWVLELASIWKVLGIGPESSHVVLNGLYTAGVLYLTVLLAQRTPFAQRRSAAVACSLGLLAINPHFAVWTSGGLETRQFTFFVLLALWLMHYAELQRHAWHGHAAASLAWAAAELTRPEATWLFACAALWLLGRGVQRRQLRRLEWLAFAGPFLLVLALHCAFRAAYYGDLVPNVFYAHDARAWPEAGFHYLTAAAIETGLLVSVPIALCGLYARLVLAGSSLHVLSALCLAVHATCLVVSGGDAFEFRPLDFYWPLLSVATADGVLALCALLESWLALHTTSRSTAHGWMIACALLCVLTSYSSVVPWARLTLTHDLPPYDLATNAAPDIDELAFPAAFMLPGMRDLLPLYNRAASFMEQHRMARQQRHAYFFERQIAQYGPYIGKTEGLFPPDAVMQTEAPGVISYSLPDLTIVDVLGRTDRTIAHNPTLVRNGDRKIGRDRSPPPGYLASRGVNLEVLAAERAFGPAADYALRLESKLWMPLRSSHPEWLRRSFAQRGLWWKQLDPELANNRVWVTGRALTPSRALGFFDQPQLTDWTREGDDMLAHPAADGLQLEPRGYVGGGLVDSFHPPRGEAVIGSLASPKFAPQKGEQIAFLVGGGATPDVGVELLVDDRRVAVWHGRDSEELGFVAYDLTPHLGHVCQIRIYDHSSQPWGHVLADHFMIVR